MFLKRLPILKGYDITLDEYIDANKKGEIVRLGLHIECKRCNLSCPYCLNEDGVHFIDRTSNIISMETRKNWIYQAYELGLKCVVIDGIYEPLSNQKDLFELIKYIRELGVTPILITNLSLFDENIIKKLDYYKVSVLGKLNAPMVEKDNSRYSIFSEIQNLLTGYANIRIYDKIIDTINLLIKYEFNKREYNSHGVPLTRLGVETVITPQNYPYIPELVRQLRKLNIYLHGEQVKPQGKAGLNCFKITPDKIKELFELISRHDQDDGYIRDKLTPVYIDGTCIKHLATFNININGDVIPCPSVELSVGNLKYDTFENIIQNNKYMNVIRNLHSYIKGDCKDCDLFKAFKCYAGCRGYTYMYLRQNGYSIDESLTASDPSCWRVRNIL